MEAQIRARVALSARSRCVTSIPEASLSQQRLWHFGQGGTGWESGDEDEGDRRAHAHDEVQTAQPARGSVNASTTMHGSGADQATWPRGPQSETSGMPGGSIFRARWLASQMGVVEQRGGSAVRGMVCPRFKPDHLDSIQPISFVQDEEASPIALPSSHRIFGSSQSREKILSS